MQPSRSPLPSSRQTIVLYMVYAVFCIIVPIDVARDLFQRGARVNMYYAALLLASGIVAGITAVLTFRWIDRARDALQERQRRS